MHIYIDMSEYLSIIYYKRQNNLEAKYLTVSSMTHFSLPVLQYLSFSCTTIEGKVCVYVHVYVNVHINHPCMHICHWIYI